MLASLRNLPVLIWNVSSDELVNAADYGQTAETLSSVAYRHELEAYQPSVNSLCARLQRAGEHHRRRPDHRRPRGV